MNLKVIIKIYIYIQSKDVVTKTFKFHTFEINEDDFTYIEDQFKKIE